MPTTEKPGLTRDAIKYLAIFTMLLNHIANVLLPENTILWEVLVDIGYFTAITMCYFLVGGILLYPFPEKIWRKTSDLCRNLSGSLYDGLRIFPIEHDLYIIYLLHDPGDPGKNDGKSVEDSSADPASFAVRFFGLGDPGTGFYHLVLCRMGEPEENDNRLWSRCCTFCAV